MLSAEARTVPTAKPTRCCRATCSGDIVLESGDKIHWTSRLIEAKNLRTRRGGPHRQILCRRKRASMRCLRTRQSGIAKAWLFRHGGRVRSRSRGGRLDHSQTELGRINQLLTSVSPLGFPLLRQIKGQLRHHPQRSG